MLRKYLDNPIKRPKFWNVKTVQHGRFKKIHRRARNHIINILMYEKYPVQVSDIKESLEQKI